MNERIRELYTQAIEYANSQVPPERRYNDIYYAIVSGKHAELIIKECIQEIEAQSMYSDDEFELGLRMAASSIEKHFQS